MYTMVSPAKNTKGHFLMVLHAHLPFIRYPEHEHHLEEQWLYEAITETYIPLLSVFDRLINDKVDFRIALSFTPTLLEMFNDALLQERFKNHLEQLITLSEQELQRTRGDRRFEALAKMYHNKFKKILNLYTKVYKRDLISALKSLAVSGHVELIASAATHAYLPALMTEPIAAHVQIRLGTEYFKNTFGEQAKGFWLPECGYVPGMDRYLKKAEVAFFFLESHSLLNSTPRSPYSIYAPVMTPSGATVFARDVESTKQVWSSVEGYPGDFDYRDFYRDIGFDLDQNYIGPYLPGGIRTFTGMKYYRITDTSDNKGPYIPERAHLKVEQHADHFLECRAQQIQSLNNRWGIQPVITATFDAELFGHWWFEGPAWLDSVLRKGAEENSSWKFITPSEYLADHQRLKTVTPAPSSWGYKGHSETWIDASNSWIYRHVHHGAKEMKRLAVTHRQATGHLRRALNQAARELLIAQSSDWPFMMKAGNASEFATKKFKEHMQNFIMLHDGIVSNNIDTGQLSVLEQKNCIFRDLDYRIFSDS